MAFRKLGKSRVMASYVPLYEKRMSVVPETDKNGNVNNRVVFTDVQVNDEDYLKDLPRKEEYTLSNLLEAGVPLNQVDVNDLMQTNLVSQLENLDVAKGILKDTKITEE